MNKPIYMLLKEVKKTSGKFDATHKVALYDVSKTSNNIPKWFKKFHEEEFKPLQKAFIESQTKPPKYFVDFVNEQREFNKQVLDLFNQVFTRLDKIDSRIDNLVTKNNLKE